MLHSVRDPAAPIAAVAQHGRGTRRAALAYWANRRQPRVAAPEQGGHPALPTRLAATGLRRRARRLPDRSSTLLQKEHPA
ncbi:hypothetical protein BAE40_13455 [Mesorhizobium loti]|nr:hypothetical protein BAE40_13455 [Mesorhizobium loti]